MKKYIPTIIGVAAGIGFTGLVAYATVQTTPLEPIAEVLGSEQEQMLAGVAASDAPAATPILPAEPTSTTAQIPSTQSELVAPAPAVLSPITETPTQPDEPARNSRYEDDGDENEDDD